MSSNLTKLDRFSIASIFLVFQMTCALIGCAPFYNGHVKLVSSEGNPIYKQALINSHFVGTAERESLESSRNDARLDAQRQIIESLGMRIDVQSVCHEIVNILERRSIGKLSSESSFQEYSSYSDSSRIYTTAEAILQVRTDGYYTDIFKRKENGRITTYYQTWCRIYFDRDEYIRFANEYANSNLIMTDALLQMSEENYLNKSIIRFFKELNEAAKLNEEVLTLSGISIDIIGRAKNNSERIIRMQEKLKLGIIICGDTDKYENINNSLRATLIRQLTTLAFMPLIKPINESAESNSTDWIENNDIQKEIAVRNEVELLCYYPLKTREEFSFYQAAILM